MTFIVDKQLLFEHLKECNLISSKSVYRIVTKDDISETSFKINEYDFIVMQKKDRRIFELTKTVDTCYIFTCFFPDESYYHTGLPLKQILSIRGRIKETKTPSPYSHVVLVYDSRDGKYDGKTVELIDGSMERNLGTGHSRLARETDICNKLFNDKGEAETTATDSERKPKRMKVDPIENDKIAPATKCTSGDRGKQIVKTPDYIFDYIHKIAGTKDVYDPCPIDPTSNGLEVPWKEWNYVNPPYKCIYPWIDKAIQEAVNGNNTLLFVPVSSSSYWYRDVIKSPHVTALTFIKGYIKFKGHKQGLPRAICIITISAAPRDTPTLFAEFITIESR